MSTRLAIGVILLVLGMLPAAAQERRGQPDGPPRQSRITTFTITPAEPLPPRPRTSVETTSLAPPAPPAPVKAPAIPLTPEMLLGRWTERDASYCREERYLLDWQPERVRVVLDGRAIDSGGVRYTAEGDSLKVERLGAGGEVVGYWRLVAVDAQAVAWTETAERRGDGFEVVARPDKVLVRCAADAEPAPDFFTRARRWWTATRERWWPSTPAADETKPSS
jgi:hypothetical protein